MGAKKIEKSFILSDSSINKYGMRLMTDGYQMGEFTKNPIGYYMHKTGDGVLVRWEDVKLDGDKVIGKPVVNLEHPRAERTVNEIESGFLNAASVGKLCIMEYHLDDNPTDPENPIITVTKWYNKEASLVDLGGNRNALAVGDGVELFDGEDNALNVEEIKKTFKNDRMKKITLELNKELMGLLNLSDADSTADAVMQGIRGLHTENGQLTAERDQAKDDLKTEKETNTQNRIKGILDTGLAEGRFTAATRAKLEKQFAGKPIELQDLISDMPAYQSLSDRLVDGELPKELADKTYDELHKGGKIPEVRKKYPAKYKELFVAKFGVEPTN